CLGLEYEVGHEVGRGNASRPRERSETVTDSRVDAKCGALWQGQPPGAMLAAHPEVFEQFPHPPAMTLGPLADDQDELGPAAGRRGHCGIDGGNARRLRGE